MNGLAAPCNFVIFGATGNLALIKLLPALYYLEAANRIHADTRFVAFARREWTVAEWAAHMLETLPQHVGARYDRAIAEKLAARFAYVSGDLNDPAAYQNLKTALDQSRVCTCEMLVFYLAIRPADFMAVVKNLSHAGLNAPRGLHRIVVEKPFGTDIESARILNMQLHEHFDEAQIYRIDHYLGKETVQNLLVFRFANTLIEPVWNRNYIDHVQITVAETGGIGERAGYYDSAGAMRDMLQNHLMQILTVVAMEPPAAFEADALRDEKVKVLRSIRPIPRQAVAAYAFRARYGAGNIGGATVPAYINEKGVDPNSTTETFVAAKFYIDNWRWRGVPFYLRTGKRLARNQSYIAIRFKQPPQLLFQSAHIEHPFDPNWILLSIQPQEGMHIEIHAKQPGLGMSTRLVQLNASYRKTEEAALDAYSALLLDVIEGDGSLFIRFDEVEWAWRVVDPILRHWMQEREYIHSYPAGSWGPEAADRLFDSEDHTWRNSV
jgi:glucose-6-phosphate 1-dehydrogenase